MEWLKEERSRMEWSGVEWVGVVEWSGVVCGVVEWSGVEQNKVIIAI